MKPIRLGRIFLWTGMGLVAILVSALLLRSSRSNSQSSETFRIRVLDHARTASFRWRLAQANGYLNKRYHDSRLRDLYAAADEGRSVKRVEFSAREDADYRSIGIFLRHWASTNTVPIIFASMRSHGLTLYVRASDEDRVSSYLDSLTTDELNPFE